MLLTSNVLPRLFATAVLSVVLRRWQGRPDGDSAVSTPLDIHLENTGGLESTAGLNNA